MKKEHIIDPSMIKVLDHLVIKDKETGRIIVNKNDNKVVIRTDKK
jgi:hypothetical protein